MKAKIYPLYEMHNEIEAMASSFCLHVQIICASLSNGVSIIKNIIDSDEIDTTIKWCKALGATIKKSNDKITIKGINNTIKLTNSLFICGNSSTTAKLMMPLLCTFFQPVGIKASEEILDEIYGYKNILEGYGIRFFLEENVIRFEKKISPKEVEFDGDIDTFFTAGLMIALPLLNDMSIIKLRAPVRNENTYGTIIKILKKFHVDVKHPATMRYEIAGNQKYKGCTIVTEQDNLMLSYITLLTQRLRDNEKLVLTNYKKKSTQDTKKILDYLKKNVIHYNRIFSKCYLKKKYLSLSKIDANVENSLPLLMILGTLNSQEMLISKVDLTKKRIKKQYDIMTRVFTKLKLDYSTFENEIMIHPKKIEKKIQVDCENDPYVAISLVYLGLLSSKAIVIKNIDCITNIDKNFFETIRKCGGVVEFIHN